RFAPFAGVSAGAHMTIWQTNPVLIIDPVAGYSSWNGAVYTVIDATRVGSAIAVFEGRVWIANGRTITYTAPNTFSNFNAADGAGSFVITDEAFTGDVVALVSALEQLWIMGESSVDAVSNVVSTGTAPNVTTAFTVTNIVTNLGTVYSQSVIGYLRALAFLAP